MKGKILTFDETNQTGVISGEDGNRYNFEASEWKESYTPKKGYEVDFEVDENNAKNIYSDGATSSVTEFSPDELQAFKSIGLKGGLGGLAYMFSWIFGFIPVIGTFLYYIALIGGAISIVLALVELSKLKPGSTLLKNFIIAIVIQFVGVIINSIIAGGMLASAANSATGEDALNALVGGGLIMIVVGTVFAIAQAFFFRKTFMEVYEITKENMFKYGANTLLIGAVLQIIVIGGLVTFIGWILITIGFFSIRNKK